MKERPCRKMVPIVKLAGLFALVCLATPIFANEYYRQGKLAYSAGNRARALELFQKAHEVQSSNGNPLFYMGLILYEADRREDGIAQLRRAVDLRMDPELREKAFWKIVLYYKLRRDWDNLYTYADKFLQFRNIRQVERMRDEAERNRDPRMPRIRELMEEGEELAEAGNHSGAASKYESVLRMRSDYHPARWELVLMQMKMDRYADANRNLQTLLRYDPDSWEYHYKAGVCNYQLKNFDQALTHLEKARESNEEGGDAFLYYLNYMQGLIFLEQEEYDQASTRLRDALEKRSSARLLGSLARAEWELGKYADADRHSRAALAEDPDHHDALYVQAQANIRGGQRSQAIAYAKKLLEITEEDDGRRRLFTPIFLYLGKVSALADDWSVAARAYAQVDRNRLGEMEQAESQRPEREYHYERDFNLYFGTALLETGEDREAQAYLVRVRDEPEGAYQYARYFAKRGDEDRAMTYLGNATGQDESFWSRADADAFFRELARDDDDFADFLRYRGEEPPEEEVQPQNQSQSSPDANSSDQANPDFTP